MFSWIPMGLAIVLIANVAWCFDIPDGADQYKYARGLKPQQSCYSHGEEQVVLSNGSLVIAHTDISMPGRHGLDLTIDRMYTSSLKYYLDPIADRKARWVGLGWAMTMGELNINVSGECPTLMLSDGSWRPLIKDDDELLYRPMDGTPWELTFDAGLECVDENGNTSTGGWVLVDEEGTCYLFGRYLSYCTPDPMTKCYSFVTRIEDSHSNAITIEYYTKAEIKALGTCVGSPYYEYYPYYLKRITDTCGREVRFHLSILERPYAPHYSAVVLDSITYPVGDDQRVAVSYTYDFSNYQSLWPLLRQVQLPIGNPVTFSYHVDPEKSWFTNIKVISYPTGGWAVYDYDGGFIDPPSDAKRTWVTSRTIYPHFGQDEGTWQYEYFDPVNYDRKDRAFLYEMAIATDPDSNQTHLQFTDSPEHTGALTLWQVAYQGTVAQGQELWRESTRWQLYRPFNFDIARTRSQSQQEGDYGYSTLYEEYDDYGNCTRKIEQGGGAPNRTTTIAYVHNEDHRYRDAHLCNLVSHREVREDYGRVNERWFWYDQHSGLLRGDRTQEEVRVSASERLVTSHYYDEYGNRIQTWDPHGVAIEYAYSDEYQHAYLTEETNQEYGTTREYRYYPDDGRVRYSLDAQENGEKYAYDVLGRLAEVYHASLTDEILKTSYVYDGYKPCSPCAIELEHHGVGPLEHTLTRYFYDGCGRPLQAQWLDQVNNTAVVVDWWHDSQDRLVKASLPYEVNDASGNYLPPSDPGSRCTEYHYDALGRLISILHPSEVMGERPTVRFTHEGHTVVTEDENGNQIRRVYDRYDRPTQVHQGEGFTDTTRYWYDQDNLGGIIDAGGRQTTFLYDDAGRLEWKQHVDSGEEEFWYDGVGNIVTSLDAVGRQTGSKLRFGYDLVSRLRDVTLEGELRVIPPGVLIEDFEGMEGWSLYNSLRVSECREGSWALQLGVPGESSPSCAVRVFDNPQDWSDSQMLGLWTRLNPIGSVESLLKITVADSTGSVVGYTTGVEQSWRNHELPLNAFRKEPYQYVEVIDDFEGDTLEWDGDGFQQDPNPWQGEYSLGFIGEPGCTCWARHRYDEPRDWSYEGEGIDSTFLSLWIKVQKERKPCEGYPLTMTLVDAQEHEVSTLWWLNPDDYDWQRWNPIIPWSFDGDEGFDWCAVQEVKLTALRLLSTMDPEGDAYDYPVVDYFLFDRYHAGGEPPDPGHWKQVAWIKLERIDTEEGMPKFPVVDFMVRGPSGMVQSVSICAEFDYDGYKPGIDPPCGLDHSIGHLTSVSDQEGARYLFYDDWGRVAEEWFTFADLGDTFKVSYSYDLAGKVTRLVYPDGNAVNYAYDMLGRLTQVTDGAGNLYAEMAYYPSSNIQRIEYGNGVVTSYSYTARDWLDTLIVQYDGTTLFSRHYEYDPKGNRTDEYVGGNPSEGWTRICWFGYDSKDQLMEEHYTGHDVNYTYDEVGNRLSNAGYPYEYYAGTNRIRSDGEWLYGYDSNGNMVSKETENEHYLYEYDRQNRLVMVAELVWVPSETNRTLVELYPEGGADGWGELVDGDASIARVSGGGHYMVMPCAHYGYDGKGRRVRSWTRDRGTSYYIYGQSERVIAELDSTGSTTVRYIHGEDRILAQVRDGSVSYYHADGLGSPVRLTEAGGDTAASYEYCAFGSRHRAWELVPIRYLFTEKEWDELGQMGGLYYFGARYYDPTIGRFISPDPAEYGTLSLENPLRLHRYSYAVNNPLRFVDPDGEFAIMALAVGAGVAVTIDYLCQWRASGKPFMEYYKSGEYSISREGIVAGAGMVGGLIGSGIAGSQVINLGQKVLVNAAANAAVGALKSGALGEQPTTQSVGYAAVAGAASIPVAKGVNAVAATAGTENLEQAVVAAGNVVGHTDLIEQTARVAAERAVGGSEAGNPSPPRLHVLPQDRLQVPIEPERLP
jgi:RHS repeat-associated protein